VSPAPVPSRAARPGSLGTTKPVNPLGTIYGAAALARRRWYARHPEARHRLVHPVISVGNLTIGGSGKTPVVEHVARLLLSMGERPAILSRGYGRRQATDEATIVSDGHRVTADLDRAGDEPLMLARAVPGAAVVVAPRRRAAGELAEARLDCTVHLLDDGFQHVMVERDVNLLLVSPADLDESPLPAGRLREPLAAASAADALVVTGAGEADADAVGRRLGVDRVFRAVASAGALRAVLPYGAPVDLASGASVFGVSGIARPERFFAAVRAGGWTLAGELRFRDHHRYSSRDVARIEESARKAAAAAVLTTAKDAVRLEPLGPFALPVAWLPVELHVEPADAFRAWLAGRLASARAGKAAPQP
jgi:tetraacyldisaccharide 4'-kinase